MPRLPLLRPSAWPTLVAAAALLAAQVALAWRPLEGPVVWLQLALVRIGLRQGFPHEAMGREDEWLAHHLAERGQRATPEVRSYPIGVWMHAYESRTPSGYIVAVRLDFTEMVLQR